MASPMTPTRRPITADSALMNPSSKVIALKASVAGAAGDSLQVFDLETKAKVKSFQIAQPVVFWKWVSSTKLGIVTATSVYHWDSAAAGGDPVKVFDRAPNLENTQVRVFCFVADGFARRGRERVEIERERERERERVERERERERVERERARAREGRERERERVERERERERVEREIERVEPGNFSFYFIIKKENEKLTSLFFLSALPLRTPPTTPKKNPHLHTTEQIISYRTTPDEKWGVLIGIAPGTPDRPALVRGFMQLYSAEQRRSQALEAHAAAFSTVATADGSTVPVIAFAQKTAAASKLHVVQLGAGAGGAPPLKKSAELFFPPEFADDFPVSLHVSEKFGLVYVATKMGLLFVYDLATGAAVYRNRVSADPVFLAVPCSASGGIYLVNRRGQVLHATLNEAAVVPFVANQLHNVELALALAKRGGLPGADALAAANFERLFAAGDFKAAAAAAAESPRGALRTRETIEKFKSVPPPAGQPSPLLVYFGALLSVPGGKLNALESTELARLVLAQNKKHLLEGWLKDGKLEACEPVGDALKAAGDVDRALEVYRACGAQAKVVEALAAKGDFAELSQYASQSGAAPNYVALLQKLMMDSPDAAVSLAKQVVKQPGSGVEVGAAADLFLQRNMVREATAFLLDALSADDAAQGALQTKLLEINLVTAPQVADAIMAAGTLTHYDRPRVAQLAEKAGLYMRALQVRRPPPPPPFRERRGGGREREEREREERERADVVDVRNLALTTTTTAPSPRPPKKPKNEKKTFRSTTPTSRTSAASSSTPTRSTRRPSSSSSARSRPSGPSSACASSSRQTRRPTSRSSFRSRRSTPSRSARRRSSTCSRPRTAPPGCTCTWARTWRSRRTRTCTSSTSRRRPRRATSRRSSARRASPTSTPRSAPSSS